MAESRLERKEPTGGWTPSFGPKDKVSDRTGRAKIIPEDRDSASGGGKSSRRKMEVQTEKKVEIRAERQVLRPKGRSSDREAGGKKFGWEVDSNG